MNILVTGAGGMVGSHLVERLYAEGHHVVGTYYKPTTDISELPAGIKMVECDMQYPATMEKIILELLPEQIYHLAAQSYPLTSFTAPIDTLNTNILGTCRLMEAIHLAMEADSEYKPVIHVCASSEVFGKIPKEKKPETGIHEECPFHPASPYAISKVGTDLLGRYYAEAYGMTVMTTRMFTHTGPRRGDVFHESTLTTGGREWARVKHFLTR